MCRWLAYSGSPILLEEVLYKPRYSLIDQSMHSRMGVETTNGDGFGIAWYGLDGSPKPTTFGGVGPAWGDANLRELARTISSPLFLAHIRASTGTPVQQTNCHPFRHSRWLWQHNGSIREFATLKRDLVFAVDPSLYPSGHRLYAAWVLTVVAGLRRGELLGLKWDPCRSRWEWCARAIVESTDTSHTIRRFAHFDGRPDRFGAGSNGSSTAHCSSVRSCRPATDQVSTRSPC